MDCFGGDIWRYESHRARNDKRDKKVDVDRRIVVFFHCTHTTLPGSTNDPMYAVYTSHRESMKFVQGVALILDCARLQRYQA